MIVYLSLTFKKSVLNWTQVVSFIYHIMILVYFIVGSTSSGSAFVIASKLGTKTIFELISL
jgi:hypothetical protein